VAKLHALITSGAFQPHPGQATVSQDLREWCQAFEVRLTKLELWSSELRRTAEPAAEVPSK
jgi:hypothetical protein